MKQIEQVQQLEALVVQSLEQMVNTRSTEWGLMTSLCLAAYDLGMATKWDNKLLGNGIQELLQTMSALMECALMTAPHEILKRQHSPRFLCQFRSGLELLRSLAGHSDADDDVASVNACLKVRLNEIQMSDQIPDFIPRERHWWWNLATENVINDYSSDDSLAA